MSHVFCNKDVDYECKWCGLTIHGDEKFDTFWTKHEKCGPMPIISQMSFYDYFKRKMPNAAAYGKLMQQGWRREYAEGWK